jgi:hypothetical protein
LKISKLYPYLRNYLFWTIRTSYFRLLRFRLGGDVIGRKSTSAYYFSFGRSPISWASQLEKIVALSSCKAEYMALKEAIKEYLYLISVIKQLNIANKEKFYLFTDSLSAIDLANNPEHHAKTKHIDIQYHFIREHVTNDTIPHKHKRTASRYAY